MLKILVKWTNRNIFDVPFQKERVTAFKQTEEFFWDAKKVYSRTFRVYENILIINKGCCLTFCQTGVLLIRSAGIKFTFA